MGGHGIAGFTPRSYQYSRVLRDFLSRCDVSGGFQSPRIAVEFLCRSLFRHRKPVKSVSPDRYSVIRVDQDVTWRRCWGGAHTLPFGQWGGGTPAHVRNMWRMEWRCSPANWSAMIRYVSTAAGVPLVSSGILPRIQDWGNVAGTFPPCQGGKGARPASTGLRSGSFP